MTIWAADDPAGLDAAVAAVERSTPVVVPTDTVYGLAACADDHEAVATIFAWKRRAPDQVMAVLAADHAQAATLGRFTPLAEALATRFWPGPLTIVVDLRRGDLALGSSSPTVGVRVPDASTVVALCQRVGPLTATSANRHGSQTPTTAAGVVDHLAVPELVVLDGGVVDGAASTVVDATGRDPQVVRAGPITESQLRAAAR